MFRSWLARAPESTQTSSGEGHHPSGAEFSCVLLKLSRSRTPSSSTMAVIEVSCTVSVFVDHYAFVVLRRGSPGPTMRQSSPTNALVKRAQPLSLSLSEAEDQSPGLH